MKDLNKVQLTGRLGADPELRYTEEGIAVCTFRVASNQRYRKRSGEEVRETEWFRVVCWQRLAEVCGEYLRKGTRIYLEGRLKTRQYQQDGQTRSITELHASEMIMLERSPTDPAASEEQTPTEDVSDAEPPPAPARRRRRASTGTLRADDLL